MSSNSRHMYNVCSRLSISFQFVGLSKMVGRQTKSAISVLVPVSPVRIVWFHLFFSPFFIRHLSFILLQLLCDFACILILFSFLWRSHRDFISFFLFMYLTASFDGFGCFISVIYRFCCL